MSLLLDTVLAMKVGESRLFVQEELRVLGILGTKEDRFPINFRMALPTEPMMVAAPDQEFDPAAMTFRCGIWQLKHHWGYPVTRRISHGEYERVA